MNSLIGQKTESRYFNVEKEAIKDFAKEINEDNPLFLDENFAERNGYSSIVDTMTFPTTFRDKVPEWFENLDKSKLLHGQQKYRYKRRIVAGDQIKYIEKLKDIYEKEGKSSKLTFYVRERIGYDITDEEVFTEESTFIIREAK